MFRFEVESPGTVVIELGTLEEEPNNFDTYLRLFDESGNEINFNDDIDEENRFSRITTELALGTYYAGVSGYSNADYEPNVAGMVWQEKQGTTPCSFVLTTTILMA
ncbi:MAG: hypothetical protein HC930_18135 [Hydrococcus sp. SU_1_0]|nr:hypothetical protein [Hydrococcus sp. SU_1_0]